MTNFINHERLAHKAKIASNGLGFKLVAFAALTMLIAICVFCGTAILFPSSLPISYAWVFPFGIVFVVIWFWMLSMAPKNSFLHTNLSRY